MLDPRKLGGYGYVAGQGVEVVRERSLDGLAAFGVSTRAELLEWIRRVVCDHCGRLVEVVGS